MSIITPFLKQTVATIFAPTLDGYGDNTFTATYQDTSTSSYSVRCRFVVAPKYIYSPTGVMELAKAQAWFDPPTVIDEGYKINYGGKTYEVISVEEKRNLSGAVEFKKVLLR